jgi:hypothetical protein
MHEDEEREPREILLEASACSASSAVNWSVSRP